MALNSPFPIPSSDARWLAVDSTVRRRSRWNGAIESAKIDDHSRFDDPQATNATDETRLLSVVWPVGPNNLTDRYRDGGEGGRERSKRGRGGAEREKSEAG